MAAAALINLLRFVRHVLIVLNKSVENMLLNVSIYRTGYTRIHFTASRIKLIIINKVIAKRCKRTTRSCIAETPVCATRYQQEAGENTQAYGCATVWFLFPTVYPRRSTEDN